MFNTVIKDKDKEKLARILQNIGANAGIGQTTDEGQLRPLQPIAPVETAQPTTPEVGAMQPIPVNATRQSALPNIIEPQTAQTPIESSGVTTSPQVPNRPLNGLPNVFGQSPEQPQATAPRYNPIPTEAAQPVANAETVRPVLSGLEQAAADIDKARIAPKEKIAKWKNILAIGAQIGDALVNGNQRQIKGLGQIRHDNAVAKAQNKYKEIAQIEEDKAKLGKTRAETEFIQQKPEAERERVRTRVEAATTAFNRRMQADEARREFEGGKWERYTDGDGKVSRKYNDGRLEPIINPTTGEQDVDPSKQYYEVTDKVTGKTVQVLGSTLYGKGIDLQVGEAQTNYKASVNDAGNLEKYEKDLGEHEEKYGKLMSEADMFDDEAETYENENRRLEASLVGDEAEYDPKVIRGIKDKINENTRKSGELRGKSKKSRRDAKSLVKPTKPTPTPTYTSPIGNKPTTGKPVPKSKDPLGIFQ